MVSAIKKPLSQNVANKEEYVLTNIEKIVGAMRSEGIAINALPKRLLTGFVTFEPNIVSSLIDSFPCVSLPEFVRDYQLEGK